MAPEWGSRLGSNRMAEIRRCDPRHDMAIGAGLSPVGDGRLYRNELHACHFDIRQFPCGSLK